MVRTPIDDIAGTGAAVQLTSNRSIISRGWVVISSNGGDSKVGDSTVSATRGIPLPDGQSVFLPSASDYMADSYCLADLYVFAPVGAKISVAYQE